MFDLEKYVKVGCVYLKRDNDGKIVAHVDVNIDHDEMHKEIEELYESLHNLHKILGYDFTLTANKNDIIFKELEVN